MPLYQTNHICTVLHTLLYHSYMNMPLVYVENHVLGLNIAKFHATICPYLLHTSNGKGSNYIVHMCLNIYNGNFVGLMSLRMLEEDLDLIDYITIHHGDMGNGNCH
mgnify:CR=1 FL=1